MDFKQTQVRYQKQRPQRIQEYSVEFNQQMLETLTRLDRMPCYKSDNQPVLKNDAFEDSNGSDLGKRISVVKINKNGTQEKRDLSRGLSKKNIKVFQENLKGLVKLQTEEEDSPSLAQLVDKMRQRKIKYAEAMSMFVEENVQKSKIVKTLQKDGHKMSANSTDRQRAFITTFSGQRVRLERKQIKAKKDSIYVQKLKIKPSFKLREYVSSRRDIQKTEVVLPEPRRSSILKVRDGETKQNKDDNYYIKSIIDVISTRKNIQSSRRKRIEPIRT